MAISRNSGAATKSCGGDGLAEAYNDSIGCCQWVTGKDVEGMWKKRWEVNSCYGDYRNTIKEHVTPVHAQTLLPYNNASASVYMLPAFAPLIFRFRPTSMVDIKKAT